MYSQHPQPPFHPARFYQILDALFVLFSILYIIGDPSNMNNFLKFAKPFPVWIMIIELWSLRKVHAQINTIIWGLFFGSIGDILLLFSAIFKDQSSAQILFALGAGSFLIGHLLYVPSLINMTKDISENRVSMRQVLTQEPLFIGIWLILLAFSFWSISTIVRALPDKEYNFVYVLAVYGSCLVLLTMGGFFFFFNTSHVDSKTIFHAGLCYLFGVLTFFASDNFLAHGKFHFTSTEYQSLFTYLIMITYYGAQFLIGKGSFLVAVYFTQQASHLSKPIQNEGALQD